MIAQNADVAQTSVGVTFLRFMESEKTDTCALCAHHWHICAWPKHLNIYISLFCQSQTLTFMECDPGLHKTMKYRNCVLCCAQVCFRRMHKQLFYLLLNKQIYASFLVLETPLETYFRLRGEHAISEMSAWLMFVHRNLVLPRVLWLRLQQTPSDEKQLIW